MAKTLARRNSAPNTSAAKGRVAARAAKAAAVAVTAAAAVRAVKKVTGRGRKYVYFFGNGKADGDRTMKDLLGGKGSGLAEMTNAGLPVPPGFTISTEACTLFYQEKRRTPDVVDAQMVDSLRKLEKAVGAQLGDVKNPLLVSVRSGAKFSMPGMMDTILNLGMNDQTVEAVKARTKNGRFAWDSYRRFIQMYGNVVLEIPKDRNVHPHILKEKADTSYIFVDGLGIGDVGHVVLRDRQALAADGMVVVTVVIDGRKKKVIGNVQITSRGFIHVKENFDLVNETKRKVQDIIKKNTSEETSLDWDLVRNEIRDAVGQFLFQKTERRPMILPVVVEV